MMKVNACHISMAGMEKPGVKKTFLLNNMMRGM